MEGFRAERKCFIEIENVNIIQAEKVAVSKWIMHYVLCQFIRKAVVGNAH